MSNGAGDWLPKEPETVLEAALRLGSMNLFCVGELSLVLGLSGAKLDALVTCGEEGDALLSMCEDADFMSLLGLNSGVVACGDGVLPRPDDAALSEDGGLGIVIRSTSPATSDLLAPALI